MKASGNLNEQRTAAASYILNFYQTVVDLKSAYANYVNLLAELGQKYKNAADADAMTETEREALKQQAQVTRYHVVQSYVDFSTIHEATSSKDEDNPLKKPYEKLTKDFILDQNHLEAYVFGVNRELAVGIIKDLLQTSQDVIEDIYGE